MASLSAIQRRELMDELAGLKRFCLSLTGSEADADDLLQGTVERLLDRGVPEDAHMARWAYRVCKNLWIDEVRAREVRSRHAVSVAQGAPTPEPADSVPSAEQVSATDRQLDAVYAALGALPEEQRLALILVAVEGKSYAETAEILAIPIGTVMSRIARARKQLLKAQE
jgi:RNA polymerase sigma factor (sigma-70 family)